MSDDFRVQAANASTHALIAMTPGRDLVSPAGHASLPTPATSGPTVPPGLIAEIRLHYRLAKSAETSRIRIDHGLTAFVRVYLTDWTPGAYAAESKEEAAARRKKEAAQAVRVVKTIRDGTEPKEEDAALCEIASAMVLDMYPARAAFIVAERRHEKIARRLAKRLPAWERVAHIKGFGLWGLCALIGEAGDLGAGGVRSLYYRLGLAPDDAYPRGEKSTGLMIPRKRRGRMIGIIAMPLFRAQWRGEKDGVPAHAIGYYGQVYGETKARALAAGKSKGHANNLARRVMLKALLHDVHAAWRDANG
jgi:hypothetical protein